VGPPSPYGPPPAALSGGVAGGTSEPEPVPAGVGAATAGGQAGGQAVAQPVAQSGTQPGAASSAYDRHDPYGRPGGHDPYDRPHEGYGRTPVPHDAPPPVGFASEQPPPHQPHQPPAHQPQQPYEPPQPHAAPTQAGQAGQLQPSQHSQQPSHEGGSGHGTSDPYAVPTTPAYAAGGPVYDTPPAQPGAGGPGGPGGPVWGAPVPTPPEGKRRRVGGLIAAVVVAALVAGGVGGGIGYGIANNDNDNGSTTVSAPADTKALNRAPTSVAGIANKALPSVVTIKASGSQESGTGTGFVFDTQGHILTNNHVVAPAANGGKLTVTFSNGTTYDASVVGRAQGYDVAVVKLKNASSAKLTPLPLGNSDQTQVGDATIAIGAPYGLSGTVTTGIVSAMHRPVASSDEQGSSASYMSAIQTDASINPGNSGGPLLNAQGAVIGINSAIQPGGTSQPGEQGGSVGLGFAIPINQARRVADQLIKTGVPVYPVIGVSLNTQYQGEGAQIASGSDAVTAGGPGAKAGLKAGDVITKFDDQIIDSGQTLIGEIWQHQPGDKATITYTRDGSSHTTTVTLGSRTGDSN
jgi:putative serine protease PepD